MRRRWLLPLLGGVALVVVGIVVALVLTRGGGGKGGGTASSGETKACTLLAPSEIGPIFGAAVGDGKLRSSVAPDNCEWTVRASSSNAFLLVASGYRTEQIITPDASKGEESVPGLANASYDPKLHSIDVGRARHLISLQVEPFPPDRAPTKDDLVRLMQLVLGRLGL